MRQYLNERGEYRMELAEGQDASHREIELHLRHLIPQGGWYTFETTVGGFRVVGRTTPDPSNRTAFVWEATPTDAPGIDMVGPYQPEPRDWVRKPVVTRPASAPAPRNRWRDLPLIRMFTR